jgi:hypothetical protein
MIPSNDLAFLSGNSTSLSDFEGQIGGTCGINRREIDSQR